MVAKRTKDQGRNDLKEIQQIREQKKKGLWLRRKQRLITLLQVGSER